ncbi:RNA-directed DNA polymerase, eukaryota [Tanacetum coccineum]
MGSFRSKEDDVSKISTSIFITNFLDSFSAKDLFHSCKKYGHVVDSFIPTKRTKDGKRFGFVRFINVFNVERLVNNLCTIWVGRSKFHANVARFKREYMKGSVNVDKTKNESNKRKFDGSHKNVENTVIGKSFVSVVKTSRMPIDKESPPAIVLEDDCLNAKDLTLSLMGRVKEMASLVNLKKALCNEGFDVVKISYLGELWVLLEFETAKAKDSFRGNVGVGSWFSVIKQAYAEFVLKGWTPEFRRGGGDSNYQWRITMMAELMISWQIMALMRVTWEEGAKQLFDQPDDQKDKHSEDPFGLYPLLNKENIELARKVTEKDHSLTTERNERVMDNSFVNLDDGKDNSESVNKNSESKRSGHSKYSVLPRTGGSILNLMEEVVKVGQTMGLQETKMGSIDLSSVRSCWGNSNFDYVHSDSVGNSGGILCIWDPNSFRRSSFTRSDYFVIVRGVWLKLGIDLMIVVVYAPQEAKEKRIYGSNFNAHDAEIFNSFIYNAGLDEVPLGGSAYTWCLKSASKMSKLDRFFVSENLLSMCPNITAITLEQFISDHRPILLREVNSRGEIYFLKEELRSCDEVIDKGDCSNEVVHKRTEILNKIHQVNNIQASKIAQKAKIKWAIEGDENVKFFHEDMERMISKEEVKRAVWDCGVDKSPGPDGFSFSFYRHFWPVIEKDVFEAVDYFFMYGEIPNGCNSKLYCLILNP